MTMIFMDSCEADHIDERWTYKSGSLTSWSASAGRWGSGAYKMQDSEEALSIEVPEQDTYIVNFSLDCEGIGSSSRYFLGFSAAYSDPHMSLSYAANNLILNDGDANATEVVTVPIDMSGYHHVEAKCYAHDTSGYVQVKIDGVLVIDYGPTDTKKNASTNIRRIVFGPHNSNSIDTYIDDVIIMDTTGSYNNDFIGDVRIHRLNPSADTAQKDFTASTGIDNYALVDDNDGDTGYVYSSTSGDEDIYALENSPAGAANIKAVGVVQQARKEGAGSRGVTPLLYSGTATSTGSEQNLGVDYVVQVDVVETDPNTGAAWGTAGIDAAQLGVKVTT